MGSATGRTRKETDAVPHQQARSAALSTHVAEVAHLLNLTDPSAQ